jgi:hypothetical protein
MTSLTLSGSPRLALFTASVLAFVAADASAFCGLASCPRPAQSHETPTFEAGLRTRLVSFDVVGNEGHYLVTAPRLFFNYDGFAAGAEVPLTRLNNGGVVSTGLSNPVIMGRYARRLSHVWSAEVGLQWELPLGNQEEGLAGDHHMLLPWLGARREFGASWYATVMAGFSTALEGEHAASDTTGGTASMMPSSLAKAAHAGHDHGAGVTPVLVNPHADREAQWRVAAGWVRGPATLEGFTIGQFDATHAHTGTYARAGASLEWTLAHFTAVQLIADAPVTSTRRNDLEVGVAVKTGW